MMAEVGVQVTEDEGPKICTEPNEAEYRFRNASTFIPPFVVAGLLLIGYIVNVLYRINSIPTPEMTVHETMIFLFLANGVSLIFSHHVPENFPWCDVGRSFKNAALSALSAGALVSLLMLVYDTTFRGTWMQTNHWIGFLMVIIFMLIIIGAGFATSFIAAMQASALTTEEDVENFNSAAWFSAFLVLMFTYIFYYIISICNTWMFPQALIDIQRSIANRYEVSDSTRGHHEGSDTPDRRRHGPRKTKSDESTGSTYANKLAKEMNNISSVSQYNKLPVGGSKK